MTGDVTPVGTRRAGLAAQVRRAAWAPGVVGGLLTMGMVAAALVAPGRWASLLHWYAIGLAACVSGLLLLVLRDAAPTRRTSAFEAASKPIRAREAALAEIELNERLVTFSSWIAGEFHFRLRPLLRQIARDRLSVQLGVDLDAQPEVARRLLGGPAWEAIQPVEEPRDRHARGPSLAEIDRMIGALEAL
jgi:hypothetical protein